MTSPSAPPITGWLKKEADKGLKMGNLIKKPFNDRYFVLDSNEKRLYYYEKEQSEVPNGFVDLSKVSKIAKTGKHETEFLIEFNDGGSTNKTYLLHAPNVPQMELWIKAIGIVRDSTKFKTLGSAKNSASVSPATSASQTIATTSNASMNNKAADTGSDSTFKTALDPKTIDESAQPTASAASGSSSASPSSASLPKRTSVPASGPTSKAPNSTEVPRSGNSLLGSQRASMHPSSKPSLSQNMVSRTAAFEPNTGKNSPSNRWSSPKMPVTKPNSATPSARTSPQNVQTPNETGIGSEPKLPNTPPGLTSSHAPAPSQPPQQASKDAPKSRPTSIDSDTPISPATSADSPNSQKSRPTSTDLPNTQKSRPNSTDLTTTPKSRPTSEDLSQELDSLLAPLLDSDVAQVVTGSHRKSAKMDDGKSQKEQEETFRLGDQEVVIRSSLSSLAPQKSGTPLLSDAELVSSSSPVIKTSNTQSDMKLSSGTARSRPVVPSPLSLLEDRIGSKTEHFLDEQTEKAIPRQDQVRTPDHFISLLLKSKSAPDEEIQIQLNDWSLLGIRGTWVMQSAFATRESVELNYDPDTSFTWHLPGFLQVRWYGHDQWHVSTREINPADEIHWDLATIGKRLSSLDALIPIPRQALIYHLYSTVKKILDVPCVVQALNAFEVPLEQKIESLSDPTLERLIRSDLCSRLAAVLLDGFNDWSLLRTYHIWDFIHDAALSKSNFIYASSAHLPLAVKDISISSIDPNIQFRNFVTTAIGNHQLYFWMAELFSNQTEVSDYFDDISLVRQLPTMILHALAPLSNVPVLLNPELSPPNNQSTTLASFLS